MASDLARPWRFLAPAMAIFVTAVAAACAYWHGDYGLTKTIDDNAVDPDDSALVVRLVAPKNLLPVYLCSASGGWNLALRPGVAADRSPATDADAKALRRAANGYFYSLIRPGPYVFRLLRPTAINLAPGQNDSLAQRLFGALADNDRRHPPAGGVQIDNRFFAFTVPANKLLYLGTVQAKGFAPLQRNDPGAAVGAAIGGVTREKDTLRAFVAECPEVYALYENRVVTY
jgi:hypothetical protein